MESIYKMFPCYDRNSQTSRTNSRASSVHPSCSIQPTLNIQPIPNTHLTPNIQPTSDSTQPTLNTLLTPNIQPTSIPQPSLNTKLIYNMHTTPNIQPTPNIPSAINIQPVKIVHSIPPGQEFLQYADVQPSFSLYQSNPQNDFYRISDRKIEILINKSAERAADIAAERAARLAANNIMVTHLIYTQMSPNVVY